MAESDKIDLKVGIYPWIPDLGKDKLQGLKDMIKYDFERKHPNITLSVSSSWDPYDVDKVTKNLSDDPNSFDVLEIDTILLGEIVDKGNVQKLDLSHHGLQDDFMAVGLDAVTYKGSCYGVPTLNCANFLIELISGTEQCDTEILCSLEKGDHNLGDLKQVVRRYYDHFKGVSPMIGDFRGKWTLPMMYLDAYVDVHGNSDAEEGIDAPIDTKVLENMKWFMDLGDDTDGNNKGERDEYDSASERDKDISKSDHVMLYGYSEWLSQVMSDKMCKNEEIHATCIISPPLGKDDRLLAFTDAAIVNKFHYSDPKKATAIVEFLKFYTSLEFRNKYAKGVDLKDPHPPRYVMISRKDFYTDGFGAGDKHYQQFRRAFDHAVAAPNYGLADKHKEMNDLLIEKLNLPKID